MELLPTLRFVWSVGGALKLSNKSPVYTAPVSTAGCDQLCLLISTTPAGISETDANAFVRVYWAGMQTDGTGPANFFMDECVEVPAALVAGAQGYSLVPKEGGPLTTRRATHAVI